MDSLTNFTAKLNARVTARVTVTEFVLFDLTEIEAILFLPYRPGSHFMASFAGLFAEKLHQCKDHFVL